MIEYIQNNIVKNTMTETTVSSITFKKKFTLFDIQLNRGKILNTDYYQKSIHSKKVFLNVDLGEPWNKEADPIGDINRLYENLKKKGYI